MINLDIILWWLAIINVLSVAVCIFDKLQAKRGGWRVSEKALFTVSLLGGALGMYITMRIIRHKTRHRRFMIGLPLIIVLQIILCYIFIDSGAYLV